jgi:hypothetical protein
MEPILRLDPDHIVPVYLGLNPQHTGSGLAGIAAGRKGADIKPDTVV